MRTSLIACLAAAGLLGCQAAAMDAPVVAAGHGSSHVVSSPYEVELLDAAGRSLPTFDADGRFYVLGNIGERYRIRVSNPTSSRIEAVVSVDGLDVIDGETATVGKRGYVVGPHSNIVIDGFRVSTSHVAAFRFSSVARSYAGRKGVARNVGVIGVAVFAERARPELALPEEQIVGTGRRDGRFKDAGDHDRGGEFEAADASTGGAPATAPPPRTESDSSATSSERCCGETRQSRRRGLGTEFGERRHSAVQFTRFVRGNPTVPTAVAEVRYNDATGLSALGIDIHRGPDDDELVRRETAEPFPGERFAKPPR